MQIVPWATRLMSTYARRLQYGMTTDLYRHAIFLILFYSIMFPRQPEQRQLIDTIQ